VGVRVPGIGIVVVVVVALTGQLQDGEPETGGDQDRAHDRALCALDRRAELKADGDDHAAEHDRDQDMGHAGQARQPGHAGEWIATRTAEDRQRHPVVGQNGVPKTDAGSRSQECRTVLSHAGGLA
jgi:hypothetical protein